MYGMGSDYLLSEECSYGYLAQKIVEMEDPETIRLENEWKEKKANQKKYLRDIQKV